MVADTSVHRLSTVQKSDAANQRGDVARRKRKRGGRLEEGERDTHI